MPRALSCALLVAYCSVAIAQEGEGEGMEKRLSPTPWYLPRQALLGSFVGDAVTPQLRLQWEITLIQERVDSFELIVEGGGGYGVSFPTDAGPNSDATMRFLYQYVVGGGVAYRGTQPFGLHYGAQVTLGALFYGAHFDRLAKESTSVGVVEGRAELGWRFGDVTYGIAVGTAQAVQKPVRVYSAPYIGGLLLGLFVDWR